MNYAIDNILIKITPIVKNILLICILVFSINGFTQGLQKSAPWMNAGATDSKNSKKTFKEITEAAEAYFKTVDKFKKGSGLKPYERWKYRSSFFIKPDGTISNSNDLWEAWEMKNAMRATQRAASTNMWTSVGPYSHTNTASWSSGQGRVNVVAVDPSNSNTYYAGAPAGGIWKSTDAGVNWTPLTDHLPQIGVSGIAIHPTDSNTIYIATGDDDAGDSSAVGVWKSTDGGTTWNNTGTLNASSMNEIYIHPSNHETVLVATSTGVYKTTNGGTNWVRKLNANIIDLKMKPNDASTWYAASGSTIYRSTDGGENFTSVTIAGFSNSARIVIDVTPADPDLVYFVSAAANTYAFNGVYKSTDSGVSFTKTVETDDIFGSSQAWFDLALTVSDTQPNTVFVGVLNIWRSTDGGGNFTRINSWNAPTQDSYTHADIHFMRYIGGKLFAGTDGGVYVSTNDGTKFTDLTKNIVVGQFYRIAVAAQNHRNIVGGLQDNGGYARYQNNWNNYHGADGMDCSVNPLDPKNYFGFIQYGGALYETKDGGLTRNNGIGAPSEETGTGDSGGRWVTPMVSNSQGEIYAGYGNLYKLENGAWTKISNETFFGDLQHIEIDPKNDDNIYVSMGSDLYRSTNKGVNFTQLTFANGIINVIEVSHTDENTAWIVTNSSVYKITNLLSATPTFSNITGNLPLESKLVLRHHERSGNNSVYLGTALGVYTINDDISNWQVFDNNLPNVAIRDLEINEEEAKLIAATYGRGVFQTDIPEQLPPADVRLLSINAPSNQVNCSTTISPNITVRNKGANPLTSITVNYTVDLGATNTFNWSGNLNSGEDTNINIPDMQVAFGSHTISIEVTTAGDAYASNNTLDIPFLVNSSNTTPATVNSFEDNTNDALASVTTGSTNTSLFVIARPGKTLLNAAGSGNKVYITAASGNYPDNTISYLYTNCYDLSTLTSPVLAFKMSFDIENNWDYLVAEYSTDSGVSWSILGSASDSNWYTSASIENGLPGGQWTGLGESSNPSGNTNAIITDYSYDLGAFTNETNIIFRFKFVTDQAVNEEGVVIDDLVINGVLSVSDEELLKSLSIYPNPSNELFTIHWNTNEKASISVYNYLGKLILNEESTLQNEHEINLKGYSKGLYFVKITSANKQAIKKIILE
ncbi:MAG: T9SS type A sorting domain-containing protein [Flavobacteriaceae bacterium]|nr:MAG: T9SS type A sorting domain-containing protein [Flavobacteriaceae bacterium]